MNANDPVAGGLPVPEDRKSPPRENLVRAVFPGSEFRDDGTGSAPMLAGHLAVFDQWTEINSMWEGRFLERISPGAFKKTMKEQGYRVRVTLNHGTDPMLGDKPLGVVESLAEDQNGAAYEVSLFRGIPDLVMEGLRAGQYGASFRFQVVREDLVEQPDASSHNPAALPERTIKELRLLEFGPVTFPAYEGATAGVRSLTDRFLKIERDDAAIADVIADTTRTLADRITELTDPAPSEDDAEPAVAHLEPERRDQQEQDPATAPGIEPTPRAAPRKDYLKGGTPSWRL